MSPLKIIRDALKLKKAVRELVVQNSVINTVSGEIFCELSTDKWKTTWNLDALKQECITHYVGYGVVLLVISHGLIQVAAFLCGLAEVRVPTVALSFSVIREMQIVDAWENLRQLFPWCINKRELAEANPSTPISLWFREHRDV